MRKLKNTASNIIRSIFTKRQKTESRSQWSEVRNQRLKDIRKTSAKTSKHIHPKRDRDLILNPSGFKYQCVRLVTLLIMMSMFVTSNPAAPKAAAASASEFHQDMRFAYLANASYFSEFGSNMVSFAVKTNPILSFFFGKRDKRQRQKISKIEIVPGKNVVIREGEQIHFSAIAYDSRGDVVQGTEFKWLAAKGAKEMAIESGMFESGAPGVYYVGAKARGVTGTRRIVVREDVEFRAMKEISRQEREAAETKAGVSNKNRKQKKLRKEVTDAVREIKANRAPSIKNSTKMRKADKAKLKQWDDAQKIKRKAARKKRKERRIQKRQLKKQNPQNNTRNRGVGKVVKKEAADKKNS